MNEDYRMKLYALLSKLPLGTLSEKPAAWINNSYISSTNSGFSKVFRFLKTRAMLLTMFPIAALIDTLIGQMGSWFLSLISHITSDKQQKQRYQLFSAKLYNLSVKNFWGLLAVPIGFFNPKRVANNFIPQPIVHYKAKKNERNYYRNIQSSKENKKLFGQFLDNILQRVDKDKYFALMEDILSYSHSNLEIYAELKNRIDEIKPSYLGSAVRVFRSLSTIKEDLSEQALKLMKSKKGKRQLNGMVEIGYPGRFVNSMKNKLNISGQISIVNTEESMSDLIQTGFPRPYDKFVPLNDYAPFKKSELKDNSVDLVTCYIGLHHIPEKKLAGFLQSIKRILRPGGTFLLVDHDVRDNKTRDLACLAHSVYNAVMGAPIEEEANELRHFKSLDEWKSILAENGFNLEQSTKKSMIREGDPTLNTMLRFVKKEQCKAKIKPEDKILNLKESPQLLFRQQTKPVMVKKNKVANLPSKERALKTQGCRI